MTHHQTPWNLDRRVGPRTRFTPVDICTLVDVLRLDQAWHDLCLLTMGIDSMLRCGDLLSLRVRDVCDRHGVVQDSFFFGQEKTGREVAPALTQTSRNACQRWVGVSGKSRNDFLFTRSKKIDDRHINDDTYRGIVKAWAERLGLNPEGYSTHSLRRSKPHFMHRRGVEIEYISELLGHKNTATTYRYLGITREEAQERALSHDIFKKSLHRIGAGRHRSIKPCLEIDIFTAGFEELRIDLQHAKAALVRIETQLCQQSRIAGLHTEQLNSILTMLTDQND